MKRDPNALSDRTFDIFVIGGGIHGAALAHAASRAGYRTGLVDKSDFCAATSANSLKIIHGGLRYLQHGNLKRMRHSIRSRRAMMRLAPRLLQPIPCLMPLYGHGLRGREALHIALWLNDAVAWDRNAGLSPEVRIPSGRILTRSQSLKILPRTHAAGLRGAALWYDVLARDTERLGLAFLRSAAESQGAVVANYAAVVEVRGPEDKAYTLTVEDRLTGRFHTVKSRFVVNATGPWLQELIPTGRKRIAPGRHWAMGLNIVVDKPLFPDVAVGLEGSAPYSDKDAIFQRGKRLFFFVPWAGHTMIGTEYKLCGEPPDGFRVRREDIQGMLEEIHRVYPRCGLSYEDVTFFHAGLLPAASTDDAPSPQVQLEKHSSVVVHEDRGGSGLLSIKGVKYTTAPVVGRSVVDWIRKRLAPRPAGTGRQETTPLHTPPFEPDTDRLSGGLVDYFVDEEMALSLSDIVFRRTNLGAARCPDAQILQAAAGHMALRLAWTPEHKARELQSVTERFAILERPERRSKPHEPDR